jgi:hypoxanthine-DNA glycosylase
MTSVSSFSYLAQPDAKILILGSMPGKKSLQAQQYYAHPRNALWYILGQIFNFSIELSYPDKIQALHTNQLALWDVMKQCVRPSSLDADIIEDTIELNDFEMFLQQHPLIHTICFNGKKAEHSFKRYIGSWFYQDYSKVNLICLPSTSPANAAMSAEEKLQIWQAHLVKR